MFLIKESTHSLNERSKAGKFGTALFYITSVGKQLSYPREHLDRDNLRKKTTEQQATEK